MNVKEKFVQAILLPTALVSTTLNVGAATITRADFSFDGLLQTTNENVAGLFSIERGATYRDETRTSVDRFYESSVHYYDLAFDFNVVIGAKSYTSGLTDLTILNDYRREDSNGQMFVSDYVVMSTNFFTAGAAAEEPAINLTTFLNADPDATQDSDINSLLSNINMFELDSRVMYSENVTLEFNGQTFKQMQYQGDIALQNTSMTIVPEPSTTIGLGLGALALGARRRRDPAPTQG